MVHQRNINKFISTAWHGSDVDTFELIELW